MPAAKKPLPEDLLLQRLREIITPDHMAVFVNREQLEDVVEAAVHGWPFMLSKLPDGMYLARVERPEKSCA